MKHYKELVMELELHQRLKECFEVSHKYWQNKLLKTGPKELTCQNYQALDTPKGSRDDSTLDKIYYNINHYADLIHTETELINELQKTIDLVENHIRNSEDIHDKVAYLKYQKNERGQRKYTLKQIADMLVYSEDYIKEISARV